MTFDENFSGDIPLSEGESAEAIQSSTKAELDALQASIGGEGASKRETEAKQQTQQEAGITRLEYQGVPLAVPTRGLTIITFRGEGAAVSLPRSDWFCAQVDPSYPPFRERWNSEASCDGPGPIFGTQTQRGFVMRPGQREATIAFWPAADLNARDRQRFGPLFVVHLVRQ